MKTVLSASLLASSLLSVNAFATATLKFDCYAQRPSTEVLGALWHISGYYTSSHATGGILQFSGDSVDINYLSRRGEGVISSLRNFAIYDSAFSNVKNKIWVKAGNDGFGKMEVSVFVDPLRPTENGGHVQFKFFYDAPNNPEIVEGFCMVTERG